MAFTPTDTDCLEKAHAYFLRREKQGRLTADEENHLATIITGDEAEKVLVAKWYAENVALIQIVARLGAIDSEKTGLLDDEATLEAYIA